VYGATKLDGEVAVREATDGDAIVIRTAWLYSRFGHNFVKTMLRLMEERDELSVVADQHGTPTWARSLAEVIWAAIGPDLPGGVYHWTDGGEASWFVPSPPRSTRRRPDGRPTACWIARRPWRHSASSNGPGQSGCNRCWRK
jgi:nucleoside-diphosphate-sugar epimerase